MYLKEVIFASPNAAPCTVPPGAHAPLRPPLSAATGPFLPSLVFVGLLVFPLGEGTGQTDRQTDEQNQHMMGPPSRKDGPITILTVA